MLRDITLGQYYPVESFIHKLDPRTKIKSSFFIIISLFVINKLYGFALIFLLLSLTIYLSKVPVKFIFRGLKPILLFIVIAVIINIFLTPGKILFEWWIFKVTDEGIYRAFVTFFRFTFLITISTLVTLTTSPTALTDGIERIFTPLKIIKFPAHEIAMMMTIALRFIPTLISEADKIMKAQMSRGADFESGNIFKRGKSMIPLLVPLFISAFRRAGELAMAMEARCYKGGEGRTRLNVLTYTNADRFIIVFSVLFLIGAIFFL